MRFLLSTAVAAYALVARAKAQQAPPTLPVVV
jgi:hypothetical protein